MKRTFDWKYLLGTILAVAAVALPAYQWQSELKAHDLSVRLIATSSLQPLPSSEIYKIQMTVNGTQLANPHFTTVEVTNSGTKPILSSDFEGPIEFSGGNGLEFVTARVDFTDPRDIPAVVSSNAKHVSIAPFLINPGDKIVFSTITSGSDPEISVKARIAGIRQIVIEDSFVNHRKPWRLGMNLVLCVIALTTYFSYVLILPRRRVQSLDYRFLVASAIGCGVGGVLSLTSVIEDLQLMDDGLGGYKAWISAAVVACCLGAGDFVAKHVQRQDPKQ